MTCVSHRCGSGGAERLMVTAALKGHTMVLMQQAVDYIHLWTAEEAGMTMNSDSGCRAPLKLKIGKQPRRFPIYCHCYDFLSPWLRSWPGILWKFAEPSHGSQLPLGLFSPTCFTGPATAATLVGWDSGRARQR